MSLARFQFLSGFPTESAAVVGADEEPDGASVGERQAISWRLLGRNNRELGRSVFTFAHLELARDAVEALQAGISRATSVVSVDLRTGLWAWRVGLDGTVSVVSGRTYQRRCESEQNLARLLSEVPTAGLSADVLVRRTDRQCARGTLVGDKLGLGPSSRVHRVFTA